MTTDKRTPYITRDHIMKLLSDEETSRVSTAETAANLNPDDEYIDLEHLDQGVRRGHGTMPKMGNVLPRKAVHEHTWTKILKELTALHA